MRMLRLSEIVDDGGDVVIKKKRESQILDPYVVQAGEKAPICAGCIWIWNNEVFQIRIFC